MSQLQRARILTAAADVLAELGYPGITVTQLTARAGVSRKTFYEHFEDREGCFVAALEDPLVYALRADSSGQTGGERFSRVRDPLDGLGGRVTYRTVRVLTAIAELGARGAAPSNREIAEHAGITDQGQIARMLARLEGLEVVERTGARPGRGEANAWRLTAWGEEVLEAIDAAP